MQTLRFYGHTLDHQDYQGELMALFLHASTILQVPAIQIFFNTYLTYILYIYIYILLDHILTNMHKFYDVQPAIVFPPFGLADDSVIMVESKVKTSSEIPSRKTVIKRDIRQSIPE